VILSRKNKFLFVKGKKIAGTSVEVMLSAVCGPDDIITPITPIDERKRLLNGGMAAQNYGLDAGENEKYLSSLLTCSANDLGSMKIPKGIYFNHMPLTKILAVYGEVPEDYTIFAIERCPYRKIISLANMQLKFQEYQKSGTVMRSDFQALKSKIQELVEKGTISQVRNIDSYKNQAGVVCVEILQYEQLGSDIENLMDRLGIANYPKLEHFKKGLSSNDLYLSEIFTSRQISLINEMFGDEFEYFKYPMAKGDM